MAQSIFDYIKNYYANNGSVWNESLTNKKSLKNYLIGEDKKLYEEIYDSDKKRLIGEQNQQNEFKQRKTKISGVGEVVQMM